MIKVDILYYFVLKKYYVTCNRIRYLLSQECGITYFFFHYYTKTKVDFYDVLPLEKTLTLHNVIIHIKSVLSNDPNCYFQRSKYIYLAKNI